MIDLNETDAQQRRIVVALADGQLVSGSGLAAQLGISRAAVWKRLKRLREQGLDVSAHAGSGCRLASPLELLDANRIASQLSPIARERLATVDVHWAVDSTNACLMRCAHSGDTKARAALAEIQTAGRGRRGRQWQSAIGGSLVLSMSWQFIGSMNSLAGLSVVAGIALINALGEAGIHGAGLKWPNDVVMADRKLAGILVEIGGEAQGPCHAVIGIGINLRVGTAMAASIDQDWTDLAALCDPGMTISRNALAACLISTLTESLTRFEQDGFAPFADLYARYDVLRGREVSVIGGQVDRHGIALGIDARGNLMVRGPLGEFLVDSGEVSVRAT